MTLSPAQQNAILERGRHVMIEAGAGSGKTTTLVEKVLYEIGLSDWTDAAADPLNLEEIVAVTFTRKAAGEIKDRLRNTILARAMRAAGAARERLAVQAFRIDETDIGTIDSLASRIVHGFGSYAGVEASYELLHEGDTAAFRSEVAAEAILKGVERRDEGAHVLVRHFGFLQARRFLMDRVFDRPDVIKALHRQYARGRAGPNAIANPNALDRVIGPCAETVFHFAYEALRLYQERLIADGVLDFPHMALAANQVLRDPTARAEISRRIRLLIVDEHQDTSPLQAELLFALVGLPPPGTTVEPLERPHVRMVLIGDPKQSIYSFRHADVVQWQRSRATVESSGGRYIPLDRCYRSVPALIDFNDTLLAPILNDRSLRPYDVRYQALQPVRQPDAERPVEFLLTDDSDTQAVANRVSQRVREMLDHPGEYQVRDPRTNELRDVRPNDIAILAPELRSTARSYVQALRDSGIETRTAGGGGLYQRQEVQDVAALLTTVADPYDPFALAAYLRSPFAGVDDLTLTELATGALQGGARSLYDALHDPDRFVADVERRQWAKDALGLLEDLRSLRDRIGHDELIRKAVERSGYGAFLAGAPDAPLGRRNLDKIIRIAASSSTDTLFGFAAHLSTRIERADREEEAPLYATDDELVTLSTIHSAKGLEWPVVFVTELQTKVVWGVRRDRGPQLSRQFGVVLPLDVMLRDRLYDQQIPEQSDLWKAYVIDEIAQSYAEQKRLFYVACTRARDRLVLAGALNEISGPRRLVSAPDYRTHDSYDRWLQVVLPELEEITDAEADLDHGRLRATVRRPRAPAGAARALQEREWPRLRDAQEGEANKAAGDEIRQRIGPIRGGRLRSEFAVSEFLQFNICPWKHYYGYRAGLSAPQLETTPSESMVHRILPERRGEILHHYFGEHDDSWDEARMRTELTRILLWHLPMDEALAEQNIDDLLNHVRNYLASDVYQRVRTARGAGRTVRRETPFVYRLAPGVSVRGVLDLMFEDEDGWVVVDYKTGLFGDEEAEHEETVRSRTERYEIQAALYSMAAISGLGDRQPLKRFHFFFTPPGLTSTITVERDWPDRFRDLALQIVRRIRSDDYGEAPVYREEPCAGCEYRRICQPLREPVSAAR